VEVPQTAYAWSGEVSIAYQVSGEGPFDLVWTPGAFSNVELAWEEPELARFVRALASFCRLIRFDKRGTGLSDRVSGIADLETRMDDVRAVMDAAGSDRAVLLGVSEGGPMSILFAATYPERTRALINYGSLPRFVRGPGFPWREPRHEYLADYEQTARLWGSDESAREWLESQGQEPTPEAIERVARRQRMTASPGAVMQLGRMNAEIDVRTVLPLIRVPTLVIHRTDDVLPIEGARWMADQIPGARFVELPGGPHIPFYGDWQSVVAAIRDFALAVCSEARQPSEGVLATVLFTDIVGSSEKAAHLGDQQWRDLLQHHHQRVRNQLRHFRGKEIDTAGDGFFATFDGPARAVRCACAIINDLSDLGLDLRAGLHTGECQLLDAKLTGLAVHTGARIASLAQPTEVLVSSTIKDLVAGSGLTFHDRGTHTLKGIPGNWHLYAVNQH
jgi:pimeloyl-ACP methyl ester carboxylesterase/class 3 adenylate cyclase